MRHNRVVRAENSLRLECSAAETPREERQAPRPDIVFENWDRDTYDQLVGHGQRVWQRPDPEVEDARIPG